MKARRFITALVERQNALHRIGCALKIEEVALARFGSEAEVDPCPTPSQVLLAKADIAADIVQAR
jgi:hypothetical protein